jgi:hypothetical protein
MNGEIENGARQQRAFDRIRRSARRQEFLDVPNQRVEKSPDARQLEERGDRGLAIRQPAGKREFGDLLDEILRRGDIPMRLPVWIILLPRGSSGARRFGG